MALAWVTKDEPFAVVSGGHDVSLDSPDESVHGRREAGRRSSVERDSRLAGELRLECKRYEEECGGFLCSGQVV